MSLLKISGGDNWVSNISNSIKEFQKSEELCDVTLSCGDGDQVIEAHSLILSASSSFFKRVLQKTPRPFYRPFIYLRELLIKFTRITPLSPYL